MERFAGPIIIISGTLVIITNNHSTQKKEDHQHVEQRMETSKLNLTRGNTYSDNDDSKAQATNQTVRHIKSVFSVVTLEHIQ